MNIDKISDILLILFGLYNVIRFRQNGKMASEQREKTSKFLRYPKEKKSMNDFNIFSQQFLFLIGGIIAVIIGLVGLLM